MPTTFHLHRNSFRTERTLLMEHGEMRVHLFRYPSGVEALSLTTGAADFVLLPFKGQQIWDAWVGERRLTMQSVFDAPLESREFRKTYGAFFVHCGGTAMGSPQAGEIHLPHGELPNIPFESAHLITGTEQGLNFIELGGLATDREAFSHAFEFRPTLRFHQNSAKVDCSIHITNTGGDNMPCMYLGHINFRPCGGSRLIDLADDAQHHWARPSPIPLSAPEVHAWHDRIAGDFSRHRQIEQTNRIEPEFVATMQMPAGDDGWAHALALLGDGAADFVSWRPTELPYAVRWLTQASERQALGLALPATAGAGGREAARQSGDLFYLARGQSFEARFSFGAVPPDHARELCAQLQ